MFIVVNTLNTLHTFKVICKESTTAPNRQFTCMGESLHHWPIRTDCMYLKLHNLLCITLDCHKKTYNDEPHVYVDLHVRSGNSRNTTTAQTTLHTHNKKSSCSPSLPVNFFFDDDISSLFLGVGSGLRWLGGGFGRRRAGGGLLGAALLSGDHAHSVHGAV